MPNLKQKVAKNSKNSRVNFVKHHKLVVLLSILVLLFPISLANEKYKDWDNAQMIKGLAKDFPALIQEIEQATGLDLEQKTDCMTTTEKFSNGVKICELSAGDSGFENSETIITKLISDSSFFSDMSRYEFNVGYNIRYRNKNSCDVSFVKSDRFNLSCITAVREANIDLAKTVFSK